MAGVLRARKIDSRAASSRTPYSTPEGQTGSHARHPKQRSMWV